MTNVTITAKEFTVLSTICPVDQAYGAQGDTGSTWTDAKEIAAAAGMAINSVKGVLGSLVVKGLVATEDEVNGQKVDICCITEEGCDVLMEQSTPAEEAENPEANIPVEEQGDQGLDATMYEKADRAKFLANAEVAGWTRSKARRAWRKVHGSMY